MVDDYHRDGTLVYGKQEVQRRMALTAIEGKVLVLGPDLLIVSYESLPRMVMLEHLRLVGLVGDVSSQPDGSHGLK